MTKTPADFYAGVSNSFQNLADTMLNLRDIATALDGEVSGGQVKAPAPGHSALDRGMSIKIDADAPDGFLVNLFNGGDEIAAKDYVRAKLGLPPWQPNGKAGNGHLSPGKVIAQAMSGRRKPAPPAPPTPPSPDTPPRVVATYDYTDAAGALLYQVQRLEPKSFRQRRPDGNGGWITRNVFEGVARVPYRWPELASEMKAYPDAPVFCTEGEKDCDNVRGLGLFATCVAGSVWTPEIAAIFEGRDIIVLEDNDQPGREKADKAGRALHGVANSIRIASFAELQEKADVSDWIALDPERHNADALAARCHNAPLFDPAMPTPAPDAVSDELGEWDAGDDDQPIPPRGWLLGNTFCRGFVSSLIAGGGTGKSALRMAQLLSLAINRPLTSEHVFTRCRVLIVSLEDNAAELRRRVKAACLHHGINRTELKSWLFLVAPGVAGGKLMMLDEHGRPIVGALAAKLARTIQLRKIDIVSVDPFVKSHSVEENNNSMIDDVVGLLADFAEQFDIAADTPHHVAKGASDPGNADRGRGASSMKDALRLVNSLTTMSPEEAQAFGISEADRRLLIRMDSAKVNIAPPSAEAKWFRLISVPIGNPSELYPNGDYVQTVEPWAPPDNFAGLSNVTLNQILSEIEAGTADGNRYTDAPNAIERAAWRVIERHCPSKSEAAARQIIKAWLKSGLLIKKTYENKATRKPVIGLWIDQEKRPS
jgi:hypothetical protein